MKLISVTEAAELKKCTRQYIWFLIKTKKLQAVKVGNSYIIKEEDMATILNTPSSNSSMKED